MFNVQERGNPELTHKVYAVKLTPDLETLFLVETEDGWSWEEADNYESIPRGRKKKKLVDDPLKEKLLQLLHANPNGLSMRKLAKNLKISRDKTITLISQLPQVKRAHGAPGKSDLVFLDED